MGMRVTTSMMMNTYRYNLQGSTSTLAKAREKVQNGRKFDSYMEDPASATQAWRIRRAMNSNYDYQANNTNTYSRFGIAWTTMGVVNNKLVDVDDRFSTIRGINGATGAGRQPLGQVMDKSAETIIQAMNSAKYGDHFVFSGNDEMNPPFTWSDDMKTLYYRGVNVGAGAVERPMMEPDWTSSAVDEATGLPEDMPRKGSTEYNALNDWNKAWVDYYEDQAAGAPNKVAKPEEVPEWTKGRLDADGIPVDAPTVGERNAWDEEWIKYFEDLKDGVVGAGNVPKPTLDPSEADTNKWGEKDQFGVPKNAKDILNDPDSSPEDKAWAEYLMDQGDVKKLEMLSKEEQNVDLGMGLEEDENGKLINGTAFNRSLPGLNMLGGYGVDEDGDPKNVVLLIKKLGEMLSNADPNSGAWDPDEETAKALQEDAERLLDKLNAAHHRTTDAYVEVETKSHFLQENQTRLETQGDYLQEERVNLEREDPAAAITEFLWDYNCYNAALKIGTQLLSQTLLDYMS